MAVQKKFALGKAVEKVQDTDLGRLLLEYKII
jgi:oleate hydratase